MNKLFGKTAVLVVGTLMAVGLASCASSSESLRARVAKAETGSYDFTFQLNTAEDGSGTISEADTSTAFTTSNFADGSFSCNISKVKYYFILGNREKIATVNNIENVYAGKNSSIKVGKGGGDGVLKLTVVGDEDYHITSVDIKAFSNSTSTTIAKLTVDEATDETKTQEVSTESDTYSFTYNEICKTISITGGAGASSSNKVVWIEKITVHYDTEPPVDPRTLIELTADDIAMNVSDAAKDLVVKNKATGEVVSEVNAEIADESVIRFNADHKLEAVNPGTTTIAVSKSATSEVRYQSYNIPVTVTDSYTRSELVFTEMAPEVAGQEKTYSAVAADETEWIITSDQVQSTFDTARGIHFGTNGSDTSPAQEVKEVKLTTSGISGTIRRVVVNAADAQSATYVAKISVKVGNAVFTCNGEAQVATTNIAAYYVFVGEASGDVEVKVAREEAKNKGIYVKSVQVSYGEAQPTPPGPTPPTPTPGGGSKGCGGDIATVSVILSAISLAGLGLLLLKKRVKE